MVTPDVIFGDAFFMWTILTAILITIFAVLFCQYYSEKLPAKFPPGYTGLPVIGFLYHFIYQGNFINKLVEIKETYGPICSVKTGSFRCVWLNDYEVIREAWSHPAFAGRPLIPGVLERTHGQRGGIIFNDGEQWNEQHKFVVKTLREFGFGTKSMETLIQQEAEELVTTIRRFQNQPVSTHHMFNVPVINAMWTIISGQRMAYDDEKFKNLAHVLDKNMELNDGAKAAFFLPWLAQIFPALIGWNQYLKESHEIFDFWMQFTETQVSKYKAGLKSTPNTFMEVYMEKVLATTDPKSSFYQESGVRSFATTLQDLFIAGTETTATTLRWMLLFLATFPDIQEKCAQEIQQVLGIGSAGVAPCVSHRTLMTFMEAVMMETMRLGTLAPLGMIHRTVQEIQFHGYVIPKDTIVQSNVASVHFDEQLWPNPRDFNPNRFISIEGKIQTFRYYIPFGHGKRKCIGEALAKDELFIFTTKILQEFRVSVEAPVSLEPKVGISAIPQAHKLIFTPR